MCAHEWKRVNDIWVCMRCGLVRFEDGCIMYDKPYINYNKRRRKRRGVTK